ncbi:hypothetical protein M5D96_008040 [Drosophila gunungcola]|uniref:Uncharacterized protein n=1 Tax=Drosophila gunungcola TaxID=103775 RepID=A0A9Q0BNU9_9MUSC|nr:hypothetical protein M5D96_008040 [Drosophila gunungcola]
MECGIQTVSHRAPPPQTSCWLGLDSTSTSTSCIRPVRQHFSKSLVFGGAEKRKQRKFSAWLNPGQSKKPSQERVCVCWPAYEQENGNNNVNRINMAYEQRSIENPFRFKCHDNTIDCTPAPPLTFFPHSLLDCAGN